MLFQLLDDAYNHKHKTQNVSGDPASGRPGARPLTGIKSQKTLYYWNLYFTFRNQIKCVSKYCVFIFQSEIYTFSRKSDSNDEIYKTFFA